LERQNQERIEQLERQNQELQDAIKKLQSVPTSPPMQVPVGAAPANSGGEQGPSKDEVQKIVDDVINAREKAAKDKAAAAAEEEKAKGYVVGKNLGVTGSWTGNQLWFESKDKAFRLHFGGRAQWDAVFSDAPTNVQFGSGAIGSGGIG